jgi:hypothetical protein
VVYYSVMKIRWWNSFNLLALILLALSIGGIVSGGKMVFEPGRAVTGKEWLVYLVAAVLMVVNGILTPAPTPTTPTKKDSPK